MPLHRNIRLLTWFNFISCFRLYNAIAILYFAKVSGSFALGMSVFAITMVSSALLELPTGVFSDKIGRKMTIVCGTVASIVFTVLYALASIPALQSAGTAFWVLALGAVVEGLSRSFFSGNNDAFLHDTLSQNKEEHDFSEHLGKTSSMMQLAFGISGVIGGFLASWSFAVIMWLSVIPQLVALVLALHMEEPKVHSRESTNIYEHLREAIREFWKNPKLRLLGITSMWRYAFGEASFQFVSAFYAVLWPVWAIGVAKLLSNVLATISFRFAGRFIRRFGAARLLVTSSIFNRTMGIVAALVNNVTSPLLLSLPALTYGTGEVAEGTLFQKEFKPHQRATMGSLSSFAGSILFGVLSVGVGYLADRFDPRTAYLIMQILMLPNILWQWRLVGR